MWIAARTWRFWAVVAMLPVLYVVSSGPTRMVGAYPQPLSGNRLVLEPDPLSSGNWYSAVYRPLGWVRYYPWAKPLRWYWDLFPVRDA